MHRSSKFHMIISWNQERIVDRERELQGRRAGLGWRRSRPGCHRRLFNGGAPAAKPRIAVAVINRVLSVEEAYRRYDLSEPELAAWLATYERFGTAGLALDLRSRISRTAPRRKRSSSLPFS